MRKKIKKNKGGSNVNACLKKIKKIEKNRGGSMEVPSLKKNRGCRP